MMLAAQALLEKKAAPSLAEIRWALSGNLCRCTGYGRIYEAVAEAAKEMAG
jgi:aerobic-type carbon monoxide dehydrogenase small subunit (CoxS/CutS family)